jgi:hypothetical protein
MMSKQVLQNWSVAKIYNYVHFIAAGQKNVLVEF